MRVFLQENVWPFCWVAKNSDHNNKVTVLLRWPWGFTVVPFIFMVQLCYPSAGCKENHFYSLLFGQAEASITVAQTSFQLAPETF